MSQETLNSITSLLAEQLDRATDEPFKRSLGLRVDAWRSTLLQRSLDKHPEQRKIFRQTLWVPMEKVKPVPCQLPIPICSVARSKYPIPLSLRGTVNYDYVGGIDGRTAYRFGSVGTIDYTQAGKYSASLIYYEIVNKFIDVSSNRDLPMIRVDAVFDKPTEIMELNCEAGINCDGWNEPYPVSGDILQSIIQYILQVDYNQKDTPVPQAEVKP